MSQFLFGASATAFLVVGLFLLRFWWRTRDALFLLFAISFFAQASSQVALAAANDQTEGRPVFYLPRLVAYGLIIAGIISKNLDGAGRR